MNLISLRPIRADDEQFLYDVYASTRQEELAPVPWTDEQKAAFLRMQFAAQHKYYLEQYANADYRVILRDDRPIGRLYLDRQADEFRIVDIALLPEHRRSGIGGGLLREILAEADRAGARVSIHVERNNPALRLYERTGFRVVGDTGVYFLMVRLPTPTSVAPAPSPGVV